MPKHPHVSYLRKLEVAAFRCRAILEPYLSIYPEGARLEGRYGRKGGDPRARIRFLLAELDGLASDAQLTASDRETDSRLPPAQPISTSPPLLPPGPDPDPGT